MLKVSLFNGKVTGTPLFLAWTAGASVAYGLLQASIFVDDTLNMNAWFMYVSFVVCFGLLSTWQAFLLVPTRLRRTVWVLLYAGVILTVIFFEIKGVLPPLWFAFDWTTAALQAGVLIGARKRIWAWTVALTLTAPFYPSNSILQPLEDVYSQLAFKVANLLLEEFVLSFEHALMMAKTLIFGLVAAYCMPPVETLNATSSDQQKDP
jgi:hypothetical protein